MNNNKVINTFVSNLRRDLSDVFRKYPAISSAYLFGSTVKGANRKLSDIDIAIRLGDNLFPSQFHAIRLQLMDDLESYFRRKVDVVILNNASLKLIHQVLSTGKIIFTKDLEKEIAYAIQKQKEYFDFKHYIDRDIQESRKYFQGNHV